jgi:hypothetical protein
VLEALAPADALLSDAVLVCLPWLEGRSDLELDAELASVDALARLAAVDTTAGAEPPERGIVTSASMLHTRGVR